MSSEPSNNPGAARTSFGLLRILFGVIWAFNAWLQAESIFHGNFMSLFLAPAEGQPAWLERYLQWVMQGIHFLGQDLSAALVILVDIVLALSLLTGAGLRFLAWIGILYSLFLWSAMGGLGMPYGPGATDPGPGIVYAIAFVFILASRAWQPMGLDYGTEATVDVTATRSFSLARVLFGLLWAFDAFWKWHPYFISHVLPTITQGQQGQPQWIVSYIQFFVNIVVLIGPTLFGILVAVLETLIALSVLSARGLAVMAPLGFLFSLGIWTTAEGWGGPYGPGSTGMPGDIIGNAILYAYIFLFLMAAHRPVRRREPAPAH